MQKTTAYIKSIPSVTISWNKEHTKNSIYVNNTIIESGRYKNSLSLPPAIMAEHKTDEIIKIINNILHYLLFKKSMMDSVSPFQ